MAGRNNTAGREAGHGRAGRGSGGHGQSYAANKISTKKVGLCKDLEGNIFDYGTKTAANLMHTMQEKLIQYVGTKFGGDIANELQNRRGVVHAWVGQKRLKSNILRRFFLPVIR
jgi:hypothetical protein